MRNAGRRSLPVTVVASLVLLHAASAQSPHVSNGAADSLSSAAAQNSSYIIRKGDTLWDLAFHFLGNPFRWPEIWHENAYIRNPDLIFPGDPLAIPGQRAAAAEAGLDRQSGFESVTTGALEPSPYQASAESSTSVANDSAYRDVYASLAPGGNFSSEFLSKAAFLWTQPDEKGLIAPGNGEVSPRQKRRIFQQFDEIPISIFTMRFTYQSGDTVDVFRLERYLKFEGRTVNLVRRIGRGTIVRIEGKQGTVRLHEAWDVVRAKDRIAPAVREPKRAIDSIVDPDIAVHGTVFERIENTASPYPFQTFLIDRGAKDGVRPGDMFLAFSAKEKRARQQASLLAIAIHVNPSSSTLTIARMFVNSLKPGDTVSLVKRIIFAE